MMRIIFILAAALLALMVACGSESTVQPESTSAPLTTASPGSAATEQATAGASQSGDAAQEQVAEDTGEDRTPRLTASDIPPCEGSRGGSVGDCAPEFQGTQEWINSEPLTMDSLRGNVVLIDFWTYTCVNCIRTLPFLREWYDRYSDQGLVIVGVHTPEFEFEKIYKNVVEATEDEGVAWPVVQDNEFSVWRSFSNRYWPAKYLIDQTGVVRYTHFGEGKYGETEEMIRKLLDEAGMAAGDELPLPEDQGRDETFMQRGTDVTRELFAGWKFTVTQQRGGFGQPDEYLQAAKASFDTDEESGVASEFEAPEALQRNLIYFNGLWTIGPESARHAVDTDHLDDYLALKYSARSVNAVLTSDSGEAYEVIVTVNGDYLTEENKGADVMIADDGVSYIEVIDPKLYSIVEHPTWEGSQVLRLSSTSDDFGLFSFTFGVYEDGF